MNPTTEQVIEFLNHPELNFGTEEDLLLLADPDSLHQEVARLLQEPHAFLENNQAETLRSRLNDADWPRIAEEFRNRVDIAARFFDPDAQTHHQ
ncbi:MAG TPA: hypothetical protein VF600_17725 [Abditibacteriaceae bacterium]|jgi:predicted pyridoxine 5'-phosphate oxidase superfamily flavin-nucleotide-binding protein